jgi:hypothetical protein
MAIQARDHGLALRPREVRKLDAEQTWLDVARNGSFFESPVSPLESGPPVIRQGGRFDSFEKRCSSNLVGHL